MAKIQKDEDNNYTRSWFVRDKNCSLTHSPKGKLIGRAKAHGRTGGKGGRCIRMEKEDEDTHTHTDHSSSSMQLKRESKNS
uniref:Uncharacterized protein n=1 Tax=Leersia perrieri TaxID=77586 RepID=A0A0D9V9N5_9ORYZ